MNQHHFVWTFLLTATGALGQPISISFEDKAAEFGINVNTVSGTDQKYIVENAPGGAALFDFDNDGDVDIYVTNGSRFGGFSDNDAPRNRLYRNDGSFVDVTAEAGVGDTSWSMGCAVADYDNDGDLDLYTTNFGSNTLHRNEGDGTFVDVTDIAGVGDDRFGVGCAFGDYDRDGHVDLAVVNYINFSLDYKSTVPCVWKRVDIMCGPRGMLPDTDVLYHNKGDGTFEDVTEEAGITGEQWGYGVVFSDFDIDGWPDLFIANDSGPNFLYVNQRDGTFREEGLATGLAYSGDGADQGCMGVAIGDYDNDGRFDLFVTNFEGEYNVLYRNEGNGFFSDGKSFFSDVSFSTRVNQRGNDEVGWGTGFFDYDNDGDRDLFVANGHTYPQADLPHTNTSYAMTNFLFENLGDGTYRDVTANAGTGFRIVEVSRGAAFGDIDDDGDIDIFITNLNGRPNLLRNDSELGNSGPNGRSTHNFLMVETVGTRSNRDGIGTRVMIFVEGRRQVGEVRSGSSYLCHDDMRVHFGLGQASLVDSLVLRWPSGTVQTLRDVEANQQIKVVEPINP